MSGTRQRSASERSLCQIVESVPRHRLEAAEGILALPEPWSTSLRKVIQYVPQRREQAAHLLIQTDEQTACFKEVFLYVTTPKLLRKAGQRVLAAKHRHCYAYVIEYVVPLRARALAQLREEGAQSWEDLNAIWRYGSPEDRDPQWERFAKGCWASKLGEVVRYGVEDLPERAWSAFTSHPEATPGICEHLLPHPKFTERAFEWMAKKGFGSLNTLWEIYRDHPQLAEEVWECLVGYIRSGKNGYSASTSLDCLFDRNCPKGIQARAAQLILSDYPEEECLNSLLNRPGFRDIAAARLLAGDFTAEEA